MHAPPPVSGTQNAPPSSQSGAKAQPDVSALLKNHNQRDEILVNIIGTHNKEDEQQKMYTVYIITVESSSGTAFLPWYIGRRYNDFFLLDSILRRTVKVALPELPSKTISNKLDPMVIMTRMQELQTYLSAILKIRSVVESPVMHRFLQENRKYAQGFEDAAEQQNNKKHYLDVLIVEVSGLEDREIEEKSLIDLLPVVGKSYQRATIVELLLGHQEYHTSVIYNDLCPVWNEDCTFTYVPQRAATFLTARIWDKGRYKDTLLGEVQIELNELPLKDIRPQFLPLKIGERTVAGNLHIIIQKSEIPSEGMLAYHGPPLNSIPYRVDAGDIFLMNSSAWLTHGTKLATWSPWDHVAMAVSIPGRSRLRFFESTIDGVDADCSLESSVEAYVAVSNVGVRRLHAARTPAMMKALADFIMEVKGRPYKQSPVQLFKAWAGSHEQDDSSSFFCSQLIAAAYQKMGLIAGDICNSNFLPVDFASDLKGKLLRSKLGPLIVFPMRKKVTFETTLDIPVGSKSFTNSPKVPAAAPKPSWPAPREGPPKPRVSPRGVLASSPSTVSSTSSSTTFTSPAPAWMPSGGDGSLGGGVGGAGLSSSGSCGVSPTPNSTPLSSSAPKAGSYRTPRLKSDGAGGATSGTAQAASRSSSNGETTSPRKEKKEKKSKREKKDKTLKSERSHRKGKRHENGSSIGAATASEPTSLGTSIASSTTSETSSSLRSSVNSTSESISIIVPGPAPDLVTVVTTTVIGGPYSSPEQSTAPSSTTITTTIVQNHSSKVDSGVVESSNCMPASPVVNVVHQPVNQSAPAALSSSSPPASSWAAPAADGGNSAAADSSAERLSPARTRGLALMPGYHRSGGQ